MKKIAFLNSFALKIIAVVTMTVDHIGYFLFPEITILRIIGRIAFPVFAFLTAVSMQYTSSKLRYIGIILACGIVMAISSSLIVRDITPNVFMDLGLGALGCYFIYAIGQSQKNIFAYLGILLIFAFAISPYTLAEYGIYGIVSIMIFYALYDKRLTSVIIFSIITILCVYLQKFSIMHMHLVEGYFLLLGVPFVLLYNEERGLYHPWFKYIFYAYYPMHIGILYLLCPWR